MEPTFAMKFFIILCISFTSLLLLDRFQTPQHTTKKQQITTSSSKIINPIDYIIGDKWLDNNTLRPNNFDSILAISADHLNLPSELYTIKALSNHYYLLTRKKFFPNNRRYSLIVQVQNQRIVDVIAFGDYDIRNIATHENKHYILQGDYSELSNHWGYEYVLKISCFNQEFESLWSIQTPNKTGQYFIPNGITIENDSLKVDYGLQAGGGSTMCVMNYQTTLDLNGKYVSTIALSGYSCGPAPTDLNEQFFKKAFTKQH